MTEKTDDQIHPAIKEFIASGVSQDAIAAMKDVPVAGMPNLESLAKVQALSDLSNASADIKVEAADLALFMQSKENMHPCVADYILANLEIVQEDIDTSQVTPLMYQKSAMYLQAVTQVGTRSAGDQDMILEGWLKRHADGVVKLFQG